MLFETKRKSVETNKIGIPIGKGITNCHTGRRQACKGLNRAIGYALLVHCIRIWCTTTPLFNSLYEVVPVL